eukprot:7231681-Prymnesium_polylepis.2
MRVVAQLAKEACACSRRARDEASLAAFELERCPLYTARMYSRSSFVTVWRPMRLGSDGGGEGTTMAHPAARWELCAVAADVRAVGYAVRYCPLTPKALDAT